MVKILFTVFHFPPMSGGGVVVITGIANKLIELGHDVTILVPDVEWYGEKYNPVLNNALKIIKVNVPSKNKIKIAARRCYTPIKKQAMKICEKESFDLILTIFHPFHLVPKAAVEVGKQHNIPVVIKIDDAFYEKSHGIKSIQRKIEKYFNGKTLRNATRVLTVNQNTKSEVSKFYRVSEKKIFVIPNGIETEKFFSKERSANVIIFSGVMYHHRGIDVLLEALPKILHEISDLKLILLGDGPEMEKLKKIVREKGLEKNVEFKGWIDREDIASYLSNSKIGIGPLRKTKVTENALPIKILEYMASELPIIAFKGTLPDDILVNGKNGYFVENIEELSTSIITILKDDKIRINMGKESKLMVQKFDLKKVVSKMVEIEN